MKRFYVLAFVFVFLLAGCASTPTPEEQLAKMGYEVSNEQFLRCAKQGNLEAVKLFIEAGININVRDMTEDGLGVTALINACDKQHVETVRYLLEQGADVNAVTDYGDTAIMISASRGNFDIFSMCLDYGADIQRTRGYSGASILHLAVYGKNLDIVKVLVDNGIDLEARDNHYFTPLLVAAIEGNVEMVEYLFSAGADKEATTVFGNNAYDITESNEIKEMLKKPR